VQNSSACMQLIVASVVLTVCEGNFILHRQLRAPRHHNLSYHCACIIIIIVHAQSSSLLHLQPCLHVKSSLRSKGRGCSEPEDHWYCRGPGGGRRSAGEDCPHCFPLTGLQMVMTTKLSRQLLYAMMPRCSWGAAVTAVI